MNEPEAMAGSTYQGAELTSQEQDGDLDMRYFSMLQSVAGFMLQLRAGGYIARVLPFFLPSFNLRQLGALGIWGSD